MPLKEGNRLSVQLKFLLILVFTGLLASTPHQAQALSYYWVGDGGDWSDLNHWATTSGGSINHLQVPTPFDDVFFDLNSFHSNSQVVTVYLSSAVCRTMDWTGVGFNPTFKGTVGIRIFGSLTLSANMNWQIRGDIFFEATTPGQFITTNGQVLAGVQLRGTGGEWMLQDPLNMGSVGVLGQSNGTFRTNDQNINCRALSFSKGNVFLGSSVITCTSMDGHLMFITSTELNFDPGSSLIRLNGFYHKIRTCDVMISGTKTIRFNNIETTYNDPLCYQSPAPRWYFNVSAEINNFTIKGAQFTLLAPPPGILLTIDSLTVEDQCRKTIDSGYIQKINYIHCKQDAEFVLHVNETDTINEILAEGREFTLMGTNGKISKAKLLCNSYLYGQNTFDSLTFGADNEFILESSKVQTVNQYLGLAGSCQGFISIRSNIPSVAAMIKKTSGTVDGSNLIIRDIHTIGACQFNADNSVDLGNNSGWNIQALLRRNLYWVGDAGNWNDTGHWALNSGGMGGTCIPTPIDHVHFDKYSFSSPGYQVVINAGTVFCNDIDFTGSDFMEIIAGSWQKFRISGSMILTPRVSWNFLGALFFEASTTGKGITSAGRLFTNNVFFEGIGGEWTLFDDLACDKKMILLTGSLITRDHDIECRTFESASGFTRSLALGKSTITCSSGKNEYSLRINSNNLNLNAGTSTLKLFHVSKNSTPDKIEGNNPLVFYNLESSNSNDCTDSTYTFFDIRTPVRIHKFTLSGNNFRLVNNGNNQADIDIDSLLVKGSCSKILDSSYHMKIREVHCCENAELVLNADQIDTIRTVYSEGLSTRINGNLAKFQKVTLNSTGFINGNNIFDTLQFAPGNAYRLSSGNTQKILSCFNSSGTCFGGVDIRSSQYGARAVIEKSSGSVSCDYLILRDIHAEGAATFIADNSVDLGNNSGWILNAAITRNLYWVGNSGNWADPLHWSLTSGGPGGACLPTPVDNVFFDQNSFDGSSYNVQVNTAHAYCNHMDWTGSKSLSTISGSGNVNLHIYGSLTLSPDLGWGFFGHTLFEAFNPSQNIWTNGIQFPRDIAFAGTGTGGWIIEDPLSVAGDIHFQAGTLNTNGQNVICRSIQSDNSNPRNLILGNSRITCNTGSSDMEYFNICSENLDLSAGTSVFCLTGDNTAEHPTILSGTEPLEFNTIEITNPFWESSIFDIRVNTKIKKLSTTVSQFFLNSSGANNLELTIDTLHVRKSSSWGQLYFNNNTRFIAKIKEITCDPETFLHLNLNEDDTIGTIHFNGRECSINGNQTFIHNAILNGHAFINGSNRFDSLSFSPGKTYTLQADQTQTIQHHFSSLGNGCFPIRIQSSTAGVRSVISRSTGNVLCGYVELKDQLATGGATFYAGKFSTNLSNNSGWIFSDRPGYIYGLGADTTICEFDTLLISTVHFYGGDQFLWQDGSTLPYLKVCQPGTYWVKVTYSNTCFYSDTIVIFPDLSPLKLVRS